MFADCRLLGQRDAHASAEWAYLVRKLDLEHLDAIGWDVGAREGVRVHAKVLVGKEILYLLSTESINIPRLGTNADKQLRDGAEAQRLEQHCDVSGRSPHLRTQ